MQSKRDQVQAHTFVMGRLTSGMLLADPDAPESPLGRTTRGVLIGVVITALVAAGSLVYGFMSPGGDDAWRASGTLVVNRETGARYVYVGGRLRPVRNYASALLVGEGKLKSEDVSTASLKGTAVGAPVGIPGAPDSVPGVRDLEKDPWQVCSVLASEAGAGAPGGAGGPGGSGGAFTALVAGAPVDGRGMGAGQGLVVSGPDRARYLVWQGSRLLLDRGAGAAVSLGYGSVTPRPVSAAFLDALVRGPDLVPPAVPGRGGAGPSLGGRPSRLGQVFQSRTPGAARQYYLLRKEGLVPLTETGAALVLGDGATRDSAYGGAAPAATVIGAAEVKARLAPGAEGSEPVPARLPATPPRAETVPTGWAACARVRPDHGDGTRVTGALVPLTALPPASAASPEEITPACLPVDATAVRPGHGALVKALGAGGTDIGATTYFVADNGVKYRLLSRAAQKALGYDGATPQALPSPLLAMLPSGPDLSPEAAAAGRGVGTTAPSCPGTDGNKGGRSDNDGLPSGKRS
ncbi:MULTISPECIES: type VII secretion protein EccB [unclassified Streptomyces]|uniref:type VII secretion protein EccB n=1 Tax=unclassified Streptomyces TaxID=2593676 RepID=UPI0035D83DFB